MEGRGGGVVAAGGRGRLGLLLLAVLVPAPGEVLLHPLAEGRELSLVDGVEGGVVHLVLGGGVLEGEQVDEPVAPQHLVGQIGGAGLQPGDMRGDSGDVLILRQHQVRCEICPNGQS